MIDRKRPAKPANGATGRRGDGKCRACNCPGPTSKGVGASGLPMCTCSHLVAAHEGHGITWGEEADPSAPPRQKYTR